MKLMIQRQNIQNPKKGEQQWQAEKSPESKGSQNRKCKTKMGGTQDGGQVRQVRHTDKPNKR